MMRSRPPHRHWLTPPKALLLGFGSLIAVGTSLLRLPATTADGEPLNWLDAFFTATSAVCVTGLTVVDTGTHFSLLGQVIILVLMQVGGVGFVTMAVLISVLLGRRVTLRERLIVQESLGQVKVQGVVLLALRILAMAAAAEAVAAVLLWARWQADLGPMRAAWFAVFHSVSAFVNAGFDLFGALGQSSLQAYRSDVLVNTVIGVLIILGSLGMPVLLEVAQWRRTRRLSLHANLVLTMSGLLVGAGAALLLLTESETHSPVGSLPLGERLLVVTFHSISARTGGLSTVPLTDMSAAGWLVLMALMFVGAATASMGGGIKVNVLGALLATLWSVARGRDEVEAFERTIPRETIYKALAVMMGGATAVMVMTILLYITERDATLHLLFETVSAFGTVGYSLGVTPTLSPAGKLVLTVTMFLGRLGPLTLMAALARPAAPALVRYAEEKILIG